MAKSNKKDPNIKLPQDWSPDFLHSGNEQVPQRPFGDGYERFSDPFVTFPYSSAGDNMKYPFEQFGGYSNADINNILASLVSQSGNLDEDLTAQFANSFLQWLQVINQRNYDRALTKDQRAYEESRLADERSYNSPLSQLGRLLGTGMSREKALQILGSANSSGSAVGVSSPVQNTPATTSDISSNMREHATRSAQMIFNTALSLINMGFSGVRGLSQSALDAANTEAINQRNNANRLSGQFSSVLNYASSRGLVDFANQDFDSAVSSLQGITSEQDSSIYDYMHSPNGFNNLISAPLGRETASQMYQSRYGSKRSLAELQNMYASARCQSLDADLIAANIDYQNANIQKLFEDIQTIDIQQENLKLEGSNLRLEGDLLSSQIALTDSQNEKVRAETKDTLSRAEMSRIAARRMGLTADDLDSTAIAQASRLLQIAQQEGSPEVMSQALDEILHNAEYRNSLAAFNVVRINSLDDIKSSDPDMYDTMLQWSMMYDEMHLGSLFESHLSHGYDKEGNMTDEYRNFLGTFGIKTQATPVGAYGNRYPFVVGSSDVLK